MDQDAIQKHKDEQKRLAEIREQKQTLTTAVGRVERQVALQAEKSRRTTQKVEVTNQPVVEVKHTNDYKPLLNALTDVKKAISAIPEVKIPKAEKVDSVKVSNLNDYSNQIAEVIKAVKAIKVESPKVNVAAPQVNVPETKIDLASVTKKLDDVVKAVKNIKGEKTDISALEEATKAVKKSIDGLRFPVANYVLPFSKDGKATQVVLDADGKVPVAGSFSVDTSALATSAKQSDGSQKTQIVDAGGEAATVTGGKLDVNATASLAGETIPIAGATEAVGVAIVDGSGNQITSFGGGTQYSDGDADADPTGTVAMGTDGTNVFAVHTDTSGDLQVDVLSSALPSGAATSAKQDTAQTALDAIKTSVETLDNAISGSEMQVDVVAALPAGTNNIGDVDVFSNTAKDGSGTRYQPLVDTDGHLQIDVLTMPAGGSGLTDAELRATPVPVSGTVAVTNGGLTELAAAINGSSQMDVNIAAGNITGFATSAKQDTIIGHLDGVETTLTAIDVAVDGVETLLGSIESDTTAIQAAVELIDNATAVLGTATYSEGTTTGMTMGAVRRDADTTLVNTTNEVAPLQVDARGALKVEVFSGETLPVSGTVTAELAAGTNAIGKLAANSGVDIGDVTINNASIPVTSFTELLVTPNDGNDWGVRFEDTPHSTGDLGNFILGVRNDAGGTTYGADGDYTPVAVDANGRVGIADLGGSITVDGTVTANLAAGTNNIGDVDILSIAAGDNNIGNVDIVSLPAIPAGTNNIGDVDVASAVTGTIDHGSNLDVDAAAEQITATSFACKFGVTLRADVTNPGIVYIGNSDVTNGSTAATDGIPLSPGDSLFLPVSNSNIPYAIGAVANNKIYWIAA